MTLEMVLIVWIHPKVDRRKFTRVQSKKYAQEDLAVAIGNGADRMDVTRLIGQSLLSTKCVVTWFHVKGSFYFVTV